MKTTFIILLASLAVVASPQTYGIFEPGNQRIGVEHSFMSATIEIRKNHYRSIYLNPYVKAWTGTVNGYDFHAWTAKQAAGFKVTLSQQTDGGVLIGINTTQFWARREGPESMLRKLKRISFEFGFTARIDNGIWLLMVTDPLNWESCIGVGWDFTRRQKIYDRNYRIKK